MNLDEIFKIIFKTINYPKEKQEKFILTFYQCLIVKVLLTVRNEDQELFHKLNVSLGDINNNSGEINSIFDSLAKEPKIKGKVDKTVDEVLTELVDDIVSVSTDEQKRQILDSLSSIN